MTDGNLDASESVYNTSIDVDFGEVYMVGGGLSPSVIADIYKNYQRYAIGDYVIYDDRLFICIVPVEEPEEFDEEKWTNTSLTDAKADKTTVSEQLAGKADIEDLPDMSYYYTKEQTDFLVDFKADASSVYTKDQIDGKLSVKANSADVYTKTTTDGLLDLKANAADLAPVATSNDFDDLDNKPIVDSTYSATGANAVNGIAVAAALATLPEPMIFKGSLGTDGTITSLPTASSTNKGHTYKVITAGTYAEQSAKVGDTFISDGTTWVLIPSGDEPSGTVTSVGISVPTGLTVSGSPIASSGTFTINFENGYSIPTNENQSEWNDAYEYSQIGHVPTTRTINGKELSSDITLSGSDISGISAEITSYDNSESALEATNVQDAIDELANGSAGSLAELSDVNITSAVEGQALVNDGTNWINKSITKSLTQAQYDALTPAEKSNGTIYLISDSDIPSENVFYDNTEGGLEATNVQSAIDELAENSGVSYSTEERIIGTWVDGESLYEKTYVYGIHDMTDSTITDSEIKGRFALGMEFGIVWIEKCFVYNPVSGTTGDVLSCDGNYPSGSTFLRTNILKETAAALPVLSYVQTYSTYSFNRAKETLKFVFVVRYTKPST